MFRDFWFLFQKEAHVIIAVFTVGILSLACMYYLSHVKIKDVRSKILYFSMYLVAPVLWNTSYYTYKHIATG